MRPARQVLQALAASLSLALVVGCATVADPGTDGAAAQQLAQVRGSPLQLRAFLYAMPKGADLHSHLSGAAYAEALIAAAAVAPAPVCVDTTTLSVPTGCTPGTRAVAEALLDANWQRQLVDAWSMRSFVPTSGRSSHDHFFDTFSRFGGTASAVEMAVDVVNRAGRQRMRYVELMITFRGSEVSALGNKLPWTGDMAGHQAQLMAGGMPSLVQQAQGDVAALDSALQTRLGCGTPAAAPGCKVTVRWLQQVRRTAAPQAVFAQTLFAALLMRTAPSVVGLNFVAPEDHPVALADYSLQMRMLGHVHSQWPQTRITLHAGELVLGLVPPEELRSHIAEAVRVGQARRIGHGVGIMLEDDPWGLLREMAQRRVAVEINLSSNAQILGVVGADHPLPIYLAAGVPALLSTDDEGISRIDRTHELQRAVTTYGLDWPTLVAMERNTLEHAFIEGDSLFADARRWQRVPACAGADPMLPASPACTVWLARSPKARLQWSLEADLRRFDAEVAGMRF